MADVLLRQTKDGGELTLENGQLLEDTGPGTAVYLSLFGGNEDDSGADGDEDKSWWGNKDEADPAKRYRSELQYLLNTLPPIPANLQRLEDAASRDLAWMIEGGFATAVLVASRMPGLNQVTLTITLEANGQMIPMPITLPWGSR